MNNDVKIVAEELPQEHRATVESDIIAKQGLLLKAYRAAQPYTISALEGAIEDLSKPVSLRNHNTKDLLTKRCRELEEILFVISLDF